jgi:hypothetical protein
MIGSGNCLQQSQTDVLKESVMSGKWMFRLCLAVGALGVAWSSADAAAPWGNLISLKSVDADPNRDYQITENNGPWMVMACTFSGEGADKQAKDLVLELRKRYKLQAFMYLGHFDPGEAQARGVDKYGNPKKANYLKYKDDKDKEKARHPEIAEYAVLVGNFRSAADKKAQETLQTIKFAKPQCLEVKDGQTTHQTLTGWRLAQQQVYEMIGSEKQKLGPMRHAFVIPNPMLPPDFFNQRTIDEETIALNKDVPHSLLECPGRYTVQIATFRGTAVIKQTEINDIEEGQKEMGSQLADAAQKAHDLTIYLRTKGWEAYQYHDRFMSIVTVGSFNSPGTASPDGQVQLDPEMREIIDTFRAKAPNPELEGQETVQRSRQSLDSSVTSLSTPVQPVTCMLIKGIYFIPCDIQPQVVQVPKRPISAAYGDGE